MTGEWSSLVAVLEDSKGKTEYTININNKFNSTKQELERLAQLLSSPWDDTNREFDIKYDEDTEYWVCEYTVKDEDGVLCKVYGYGDFEEDAILDCKKLYERIQKDYVVKKSKFKFW